MRIVSSILVLGTVFSSFNMETSGPGPQMFRRFSDSHLQGNFTRNLCCSCKVSRPDVCLSCTKKFLGVCAGQDKAHHFLRDLESSKTAISQSEESLNIQSPRVKRRASKKKINEGVNRSRASFDKMNPSSLRTTRSRSSHSAVPSIPRSPVGSVSPHSVGSSTPRSPVGLGSPRPFSMNPVDCDSMRFALISMGYRKMDKKKDKPRKHSKSQKNRIKRKESKK